jgi:hypothetical protein
VLRADWLLFSDRTLPTSADVFSGTHGTGAELDDAVEAEPVQAEPTVAEVTTEEATADA